MSPLKIVGLAGAVFVYCLVAPALPNVPVGVDGGIGTLLVFAVTLAIARIGDEPALAVLLGLGAAMIAGALDTAGSDAAATVFEATMCACVGALFARGMELPALVIVLPLVVAVVDGISVASGGAPVGSSVSNGDFLSLDVPAWGGGTALELGVADVVFAAVFWTWAHRFGLRERATAWALMAAAVVAVVLVVSTSWEIPVLPLLAAAFYLPNLDRLGRLMRSGAA